jgi:hypothetical protein
MHTSIVNLTRIKRFAIEELDSGSHLRDILLSEKDQLPSIEFISKMQVWLALLKREVAEIND